MRRNLFFSVWCLQMQMKYIFMLYFLFEGNQRFVYQSKMATKERVWVEKWKFYLQSESFHFILAIMHFWDDVKRLRLYKFRLFSLSEPYHPPSWWTKWDDHAQSNKWRFTGIQVRKKSVSVALGFRPDSSKRERQVCYALKRPGGRTP